MRLRRIKPELATAEDVDRVRETILALAEHIDSELAALKHTVGTGFASTSGQTGEQSVVDQIAATLLNEEQS